MSYDFSSGLTDNDIRTIMEEIQGRDNDGIANSVTSFRNVKLKSHPTSIEDADANYKIVGERTTYKPEARITCTAKGVIIDFIYQSALDVDISILYNQLELYGKAMTEAKETDEMLPDFELEVTPGKYGGAVFLSAHTPFLWCLQPEVARDVGCNMIRTFFETENVNFIGGPEIDISKEEALKQRRENGM